MWLQWLQLSLYVFDLLVLITVGMVIIVTGRALFVTSRCDIKFTFAIQCFEKFVDIMHIL